MDDFAVFAPVVSAAPAGREALLSPSALELVQELVLMALLLAPLVLWRSARSLRVPGSASSNTMMCSRATTSGGRGGHRACSALRRRPEGALAQGTGSEIALDIPAVAPVEIAPSIRAAEQQVLHLLQDREFTRALHMYRSLERHGRDRELVDEGFFLTFIQSAIRVGKVDVVDRMLKTAARNIRELSVNFWRTTLRMLASRKYLSTCLAIHDEFGDQMPLDKIVFSCLLNAALDSGNLDNVANMLKQYAQAQLEPKDHVLPLRAYVQLGDVDSAEEVFHKLGRQLTTLMVNLVLLTCVQAKEPVRAARLLRDAHELERVSGDAVGAQLVDIVSYNTVLKGLGQSGRFQEWAACIADLHAHGLEPDRITFSAIWACRTSDGGAEVAEHAMNLLNGRGSCIRVHENS